MSPSMGVGCRITIDPGEYERLMKSKRTDRLETTRRLCDAVFEYLSLADRQSLELEKEMTSAGVPVGEVKWDPTEEIGSLMLQRDQVLNQIEKVEALVDGNPMGSMAEAFLIPQLRSQLGLIERQLAHYEKSMRPTSAAAPSPEPDQVDKVAFFRD